MTELEVVVREKVDSNNGIAEVCFIYTGKRFNLNTDGYMCLWKGIQGQDRVFCNC